MRFVKLAVPAFIVSMGLLMTSSMSFAKPEDTKKTKKPCTYCHVKPKGGKEDLTAAGKYYKENKTLDGYEEKKK